MCTLSQKLLHQLLVIACQILVDFQTYLQNNFTDTLLRKFSSKVVVNDFTTFQICYYTCVQIINVTDIFGPG